MNINRDDIRRTLRLGQHGTDDQEAGVTTVQEAFFRAAVANGSDIVLSDTNLRPRSLRPFLRHALAAGYAVELRDFRVELDELLRRNAAREADRRVPDAVIREMWSRYPPEQWPPIETLLEDAAGPA